ncbi:MAG TPA: helix-turn-helix transcriptional regulator [Firmicutes bacterium]|nr:helix-turn-helix transcriptional regulator [Candidatus Fermentithermobacillaceae bacterium]
MKNSLQNLGTALRSFRRQRGLTQEQLAERADLHSTYIAKIEAGQRLPSLDTLISIADALQIPVSAVIVEVERQGKPGILHDARAGQPSENLQQVKREISYMLEDLDLDQSLLLREIIRAIRAYMTD